MEQQKKRNYYREGEVVVIKETKELAKVLELDVLPKNKDPEGEGRYRVKVSITKAGTGSSGGYLAINEKWLNLWEIKKSITPQNETRQFQRKRDTVLFAKVRPTATIPSKRHEDGCYDIYADFEAQEWTIFPHCVSLIPTGIASSFSPKYRFNCKRERSSTGKLGLMVASGQIDSGYRGEWFIALFNPTETPIVISKNFAQTTVMHLHHCGGVNWPKVTYYPYSKAICQAALEFVPVVDVKEIPYEKLEKIPSQRGKSKFGASGK